MNGWYPDLIRETMQVAAWCIGEGDALRTSTVSQQRLFAEHKVCKADVSYRCVQK